MTLELETSMIASHAYIETTIESNDRYEQRIEDMDDVVIKSCKIIRKILTKLPTNVSPLKNTSTSKHIVIIDYNQDQDNVI